MRQMMGISKTQNVKHLKKVDALVIVENERGEILLQKRLDTDLWGLPRGVKKSDEAYEDITFKAIGAGSLEMRFFSLYDLPLDFEETSKLIVDAYAADHFWFGG